MQRLNDASLANLQRHTPTWSSLPMETLSNIAAQIVELEPALAPIKEFTPQSIRNKGVGIHEFAKVNYHPPLKSMRLVNRACNWSATPLLFRTVVLYLHKERWAALEHICNNPTLAKHVQLIRIAHLERLGRFDYSTNDHCNNWKQSLKSQWNDHERHEGLCHRDFDNDIYYQRYKSWLKGEQTMWYFLEHGRAPPTKLHLLQNLRWLEAIGERELSVVAMQPRRVHSSKLKDDFFSLDSSEESQSVRQETRRWVETRLYEDHYPSFRPTGCSTTHLPLMMMALRDCGKNIARLSLHRSEELLESEILDRASAKLALPNLRRLDIDANTAYEYGRDKPPIAAWIKNLRWLESLTIKQYPSCGTGSIDLLDWFFVNNVYWQQLSTIEFTWIQTRSIRLAWFIETHAAHLKSIAIVEPDMPPQAWSDFRSDFEFNEQLDDEKICLSLKTWEEIHCNDGTKVHCRYT